MDSQAMLAIMDALFGGMGRNFGMNPAASTITDLGNLFFFYEIKEFVNYRIDSFMEGFLGRTMSLAGAVALVLMTLWVTFKGLSIITGRSRDSMMALVMDSLRATLIVAAATTVAAGGSSAVKLMSDDMTNLIYQTVTGNSTDNPYAAIDKSLGYMQLAMLSIDALQVSGDETTAAAKTRAQIFTGVGIAGPALIGGTLLMLNRIAMALFVGLGPIFILCLLFDFSKQLFSKWLLFGIGTMFSLGVLSVMVSIALDVVLAVAASFWVGNFLGTNTEGISSMALQQGGLGMVMTMLIVTVPPMAASFFQGTLGQFSSINAFGGSATGAAQAHPQQFQRAPSHAENAVPQGQRHIDPDRSNNHTPRPETLSAGNPAIHPKRDQVGTNSDDVKSTPVHRARE
jgi:type IV secretion system protein VirB6